VLKIMLNCTVCYFSKATFDVYIRSNHNSFRVLLYKIAAGNFSFKNDSVFLLWKCQFYELYTLSVPTRQSGIAEALYS